MKIIRKKTQVTLELALTFVVFCLFLLGIINIWIWGHAQIVGRNKGYEEDRLTSGSAQPGKWRSYTPKKLEEDWVIID
ncbi:MAG: pilus assembly protein [Candidatus Omnitrophica bacterium]|nr:pilus assembly protein [Candidatus Omnitrophota bacterium]